MTYEKDIPDFALVPARQPEERVLVPVTQGAVYTPLQVTSISEKPKTTILVEEDVLVPDTRPDLKEILQISGKVRLASREIVQSSKNEDTVSLAGDIELQTLYIPEKTGAYGPVIAIGSRIAFREPWHTALAAGACLSLEADIEKIDCMVINERKFRVKVALRITAREYAESRIDVFEGIQGENIQTLREPVEITNAALRTKDILTLHEDLELKEGTIFPQTILKQDITIVENYRQAAAEKVVVNGTVHVNLFYTGQMQGEEGSGSLCQLQSRVEFTQFIPVSQSGQWSGCDICFEGGDLRVKTAYDEEGNEVLRLEGDIITWLILYTNVEKEMITDAYHREKEFLCDFEETDCRTLVGTVTGETSVREVIGLEQNPADDFRILYAAGELLQWESRAEAGKVITEGSLCVKLICGGEENIQSLNRQIPFRCVTAMPQATGNERIRDRVFIREIWAEKAGAMQLECNASIQVSAELMRHAPFKVLKNPAFAQVSGGIPPRQMAVYLVKPGDTLWSVAKRFQSTVDSILQVNQMEDEMLQPGRKLLVLR